MDRKQYQLQIPLTQNVQSSLTNGFEKYRFIHQAAPEINFEEIDVSTEFCGKKLKAPFLISSMTGGGGNLGEFNHHLACAATKTGIAYAVGSERVLLEAERDYKKHKIDKLRKIHFEEVLKSFAVRENGSPTLFFGNLGAVSLNNGLYFADVKRAVDLIHADGIFLHLNSLQEAVQENGNTNFAQVLARIEEVLTLADFPVIAKEVGFGMSEDVARKLKKAGVKIIDVAGAGGTNWATIESEKRKTKGENLDFEKIGNDFRGWGIPTAESLEQVKKVAGLQMIASGGIRNGIEAAKALCLGADLVGIALPFLIAAEKSEVALLRCIHTLIHELKLAMFGVGAKNLKELRNVKLIKNNE